MESAPTANPESQHGIKRVATASFIGTVIEFYDFGIYGTAAALVFPHVFFPALGPAAGTVASFATFGVAFAARPFGSLLFGHFGDRYGRKKTLVATMLLMGIATILVGLMPTAAQIGVIAPILLVALRILQGLAAGGEYAGAVLFSSEHAPKAQRGFWGSFANLGGGGAIVLSNATFFLTAILVSDEDFVNWAWRVPFLASFLLVIVGLWIRLTTGESPVFTKEVKRGGTSRIPFVEAFKHQSREIALAIGILTMIMALVYVGGTYLVNYGTKELGLSRTYVLGMAMVGGLAVTLGCVIGAIMSDRFGRRFVLGCTATIGILWTLALFPILDMRSHAAFAVGLPVTALLAGIGTGPQGAFLSELFHTRYRYTAAGFSYSVAGMIGGGLLPIVGAWIVGAVGSMALGAILAVVCIISLICMAVLGETRHYDLDRAVATDDAEQS
ncbi:MFS transporter [Mycolicibacterium goodii]|uniref:MFS transporter n=1 Tax=Mycolicibacterium goodii TaxID=134601 RepID=A0A0K0XGF0_MYCGD|nr:MFS transporter [Mycolicibacterium goodii]